MLLKLFNATIYKIFSFLCTVQLTRQVGISVIILNPRGYINIHLVLVKDIELKCILSIFQCGLAVLRNLYYVYFVALRFCHFIKCQGILEIEPIFFLKLSFHFLKNIFEHRFFLPVSLLLSFIGNGLRILAVQQIL